MLLRTALGALTAGVVAIGGAGSAAAARQPAPLVGVTSQFPCEHDVGCGTVGVSMGRKAVKKVVFGWYANCEGGEFPYVTGSTAVDGLKLAPQARGTAFRVTRQITEEVGEGYTAVIDVAATGRLNRAATTAKGRFSAVVQLFSEGQAIDTCTTGEVRWIARGTASFAP